MHESQRRPRSGRGRAQKPQIIIAFARHSGEGATVQVRGLQGRGGVATEGRTGLGVRHLFHVSTAVAPHGKLLSKLAELYIKKDELHGM